MTKPLSRLVTVPLREVWPNEATDFTPWLAQTANLAFLAEALGIGELELQGTEVPVGNFAIDILARDIDGHVVVIENQFGPTDHTHLGQILTYVAGQEGNATVVWVAERFREEHRAAIDWLNASTNSDFNFFAVQVEALRIDTSLPAPWFDVVGKPNSWSRRLARATRPSGELLERQKAYLKYWSCFADFLKTKNCEFKIAEPIPADYWCGFSLGRSGFRLAALAGVRNSPLSVEIYMGARWAKDAFDALHADKAAIEAIYGGPLNWERRDDKSSCKIFIARNDLNPSDETQWPTQHEWLLDQLQRFQTAFKPRIAAWKMSPNDDEEPADEKTEPPK